MLHSIEVKERERLALQASLDAEKTQAERNRLGQFATPTALAEDILRYAAALLPATSKVRFLDPALGTGAFYSCLLKAFPAERIIEALGFELDPHYGKPTTHLWAGTGLALELADFTHAQPSSRFNVVICNPPYVRHHHMPNGEKTRLQVQTQQASGMKISGLAGLYCHFLGLSHAWMAGGGIAGWIIPSEFMDVNYGQAVKRYLLERVTLVHIHRFDPNDLQFADALVSSAVVWIKNEAPPPGHEVKFTFGGTLLEPVCSRLVDARALVHESKWTRFPIAGVRRRESTSTLSNFFRIKRGLATGDNRYFILPEAEIVARDLPREVFTPILPSPRYLQHDEVKAHSDGSPDIERRMFLLDTKRMTEEYIRNHFPSLHAYLEEGKARGLHMRYLCKHRPLWYMQEDRPPAPIVCTYLGRGDAKRGKPFRFILNASRATVANVYLALYPTPILAREVARDPSLLRKVWRALNELSADTLLGESRVYGGGLHKLEPRELGNVPVAFMQDLLPDATTPTQATQSGLFAEA